MYFKVKVMLVINNIIIKIILSLFSSVTTSFRSGLKKALRAVFLTLLIFFGPTVFSATKINGVNEGNTSKARAEDARYERIYALWGALVTIADGESQLPKWSAREVLTFAAGVHMGNSYGFLEEDILRILTKKGDTHFDVSSYGNPVRQKQIRHIFEDASLLFYSLQENYQNAGNLSELRLPGNLGQADLFFTESLYQDIQMPEKSSFAENNRVRWQELVISGLLGKEIVSAGNTLSSLNTTCCTTSSRPNVCQY